MTEREIRLEIAKAAMSQGMSVEYANDMYEWVVEEPEKEVVNKDVDDNRAPLLRLGLEQLEEKWMRRDEKEL